MSRRRRGVPLVAAAAALAAAATLVADRGRSERAHALPVSLAAAPAPAAPAPAPDGLATAPRPQAPPGAPELTRWLRFPNGMLVEPLNGVTTPAPCVWGDSPWSPIVGRTHHEGIEWYVHADGSYSTTTTTWRSDLGREDAVTLCAHPLAPAPTAPSCAPPGSAPASPPVPPPAPPVGPESPAPGNERRAGA